MIWIWIIVSIALSMILLRKKHISLENYIWVLLPVDMYGLTISGIVLKPYMLFCIILLFGVFAKRKGNLYVGGKGYDLIIPILLGVLLINLFNGGTSSSVMSVLMTILVYFCACIYVSNLGGSISEIPDVIVATSIGYGLVFIFAYALISLGVGSSDLIASERFNPGIFMRFTNMYGGTWLQSVRLRGFNNDPNTSVSVFLSAFSIDLMAIMMKTKRDKLYVVSFLISFICIILSYSRMGIIVSIIVILFSGVYAIKELTGKKKRRTIVGLLILFSILIVAFLFSGISDEALSQFSSIYGTRSGLSGDYGRGSIWREALAIWNEKGLFTGIGIGQMQYLTSVGRACHNTWLEWLCSCGIIVGSFVDVYFFSLLIVGFRIRRSVKTNDKILYQAVLLGYLGIVCCLLSVDNITNSYLWFFAVLLIRCMNEQINKERNMKVIQGEHIPSRE